MQPLYVFHLLLVVVAIKSSECCSCLPLHPQTHYCASAFAIKGMVRTSEVIQNDDSSLYPSEQTYYYYVFQQTIVYEVSIERVYKGSDLVSSKTDVKITSRGYASCNPAYLQTNQDYVIMGVSRNGGLEIEICGYYQPSREVTKRQFQGFERTYKKTCDKCSICEPYGCHYPNSKTGHCVLEYFNDDYREKGQCEVDFARCGMDKKGEECVWLGCHDYRKCKQQK